MDTAGSGNLVHISFIDRRLIHNSPAAPAVARRYVGEALTDVPRDVVDIVELLVSELATNCVQYVADDFTVGIEKSAREIRVDVSDSGRGALGMQNPAAHEITGRGLRIVDQLSDAWGVTEPADREGKSVWFTVHLAAPGPGSKHH